MMPDSTILPKRARGRPNAAGAAEYAAQLGDFCDLVLKIRSTMDFAVGSRGWCYVLEPYGLHKGDFGECEKILSACRKSGELPIDICAEDLSRETINLEKISPNGVGEEVESWVEHLRERAHEHYTPFDFWDDQDVYLEVAVEKFDLRSLFERPCRDFHVPLTNLRGWSDVNSRAAMMRRLKRNSEAGRHCVLLLCGDHDPGGLHITNTIRKNLYDLRHARSIAEGPIDWEPSAENLTIIRFGLNADFINENGLVWIDNLETSSGGQLDDPDHDDHRKEYVQTYIAEFGARKCEANALVVAPEIGRQLCRDAILKHLPANATKQYARKLGRIRKDLQRALRERVS
jgi:hypothetical protein